LTFAVQFAQANAVYYSTCSREYQI